MNTKHYKEQLSAFVDQELSKEDRQVIAEHLMQCEACRREHDALKFGAGLGTTLNQADAPDRVWLAIENELDGRGAPHISMLSAGRSFSLRNAAAFATAILVVGALSVLVYRGLFMGDGPSIVSNHTSSDSPSAPPANIPVVAPSQDANATNANLPVNANSNIDPGSPATGPYWQFETIAGTPTVGAASDAGKLAVGDYLETDSASRARIEVANIGNVEIAPNSRVKLVGTNPDQHRLSLERGGLHAKIAAPPRLFIVDTPSAIAVDLGCEYTLEVDKKGNSKLNVMTGFVALERGGRESIVPAGAMCLTMKGRGLGTPFSAEATPEFQKALTSFDFGGGGSRAVQSLLGQAELYDIVTLWHLLSRVSKNDRAAVFDKLAKFVNPPAGVTRDGVNALDRGMLEKWRLAVEAAWFN